MKYNRIFISAAAALALLTACDDQKMEWGLPQGHYAVTSADIPSSVAEVLANYEDIKTYAAQYTPNMIIGIGASADYYINADGRHNEYKPLVDANYQMFTCGNAMKMDALMTNTGGLNFTTLDNLIDAMSDTDLKLYGHTFLWHTQQKQAYLKSLIAPTLVVESSSDIANMLAGDASTFDGGTDGGWASWGSNKDQVTYDGDGVDGTVCAVLKNKGDGSNWEAQFAYTFDTYLDPNTEYTIRFQAKSSVTGGVLQFQYQNGSTYGSQGGYNEFALTTEWATYEYSFTPAHDDVNRIILNFGKVGATYYVDNIEFGIKQEDPMDNVLTGDSYDFEGGTTGNWGSWGNSSTKDVASPGYDNSSYCMHLNNPTDASAWNAQCAYTFDTYLENDTKYIIQFYAKASSASCTLQCQYQNGSTYGSQGGYNVFTLGTDWTLCEFEFTTAYDDINRILLNFGAVAGDYYIDNIKFGKSKNQTSGAKRRVNRAPAASYYVLKTAEEKRAVLLEAMENWISGVAAHLDEKGIVPYGYDVVNEPIADGYNTPRGFNNVFGGYEDDDDGNRTYDTAPEESTETGLKLNWLNNHFYWGYYVPDYAVKAFQYARQYLPAETKLFINDYGLESSPEKLAALITFMNGIDEDNGSPIVDGIGTQMHVSLSATDDEDANAKNVSALRDKVDAMFKTMAATGKLVRVTELDITLGTSSPSSAQYKAQSDAYQTIVESYKENVPEAQQSGISVWTLSDKADEHEYWKKDDAPNLFDASYKRKWAYKGFCDGLAGEDIGLQFGSDAYKDYYIKNNVSTTVSK